MHSICAAVSFRFLANTILPWTAKQKSGFLQWSIIVSLNKLGMGYSAWVVYYWTAAQWNLDYMNSWGLMNIIEAKHDCSWQPPSCQGYCCFFVPRTTIIDRVQWETSPPPHPQYQWWIHLHGVACHFFMTQIGWMVLVISWILLCKIVACLE